MKSFRVHAGQDVVKMSQRGLLHHLQESSVSIVVGIFHKMQQKGTYLSVRKLSTNRNRLHRQLARQIQKAGATGTQAPLRLAAKSVDSQIHQTRLLGHYADHCRKIDMQHLALPNHQKQSALPTVPQEERVREVRVSADSQQSMGVRPNLLVGR